MKREAVVVVLFSIIAAFAARNLPDGVSVQVSATASPPPVCEWSAGDPHVGAGRASSPGTVGSALDPLSIAELAAVSASRGLKYLTVVTPKPGNVIEDAAFGTGDLSWLLGTELSFTEGNLVGLGPALSYTEPSDSPQGMEQFSLDMHRAGGVVQLSGVETSRWSQRSLQALVPDSIEIWRGGPFSYKTRGLQKDSSRALAFYDRFLDAGMKAAVAGGSVTTQRALLDVSGPGQPTTWVCTSDSSPVGIAAAIREGRTTISHEPPVNGGPLLFLEADQDGDGVYEEQMGASIPRDAALRVTVRGAPAARLRLVGSGSLLVKELVPNAATYTASFAVPAGTSWVRAELYLDESLSPTGQRTCARPGALAGAVGQQVGYCSGRAPMLALSSPIYID